MSNYVMDDNLLRAVIDEAIDKCTRPGSWHPTLADRALYHLYRRAMTMVEVFETADNAKSRDAVRALVALRIEERR